MPDFGISALLVLLYVGIIFGSYKLLSNRIKKETKLHDLGGWTWVTIMIAAVGMPTVIVGVIRLLLTIFIWLLV